MEGASTEEIIRVVDLCPTDALTYKWNKEDEKTAGPAEQNDKPNESESAPRVEVKVMKDGPLVIKGNFTIVGSGGNELRQMKMASFCRCGHSSKMPFCDGTHRKIDFSGD